MIRLNVTDLESFRYYKTAEDATLSKLIEDLAHVSPPTRKMEAGRAMARFFETAKEGEIDATIVDGWRFVFAMEAEIALPVVREMKVEKVYKTPCGLVTLVGKADGLDGLTVHDQKLSDVLNAEKYADSLQWRAYLDMFGARKFVYDVFVGKLHDIENVVTVTEYHPITFYAYPSMGADVERAVCELAEVVKDHSDEIESLRKAKAA